MLYNVCELRYRPFGTMFLHKNTIYHIQYKKDFFSIQTIFYLKKKQ